jgi:hypothetical protein
MIHVYPIRNRLLLFLILLLPFIQARAVNYYSYQGGDWSVANNWTTDPSGTTLTGPAVPGASDQVFILNGRVISTSVARTVTALNIAAGGTLDLGSSTGHNFGTVTGSGILRLSSTTFPGGTFTSFVSVTGGTIEYYNIGGAGTNLPTQTTYNNLVFSNSTGTNHTLIFQTTGSPTYTVNGNLTIQRSSTGSMTLRLGTSANNSNLNISGSVSVAAGCSLTVGVFNAVHDIRVAGNLINDGTVDLANDAQHAAATTGAANLIFNGTTDSELACIGQTDVYTLQVNKGIDQTYLLSVSASAVGRFRFFTNATGLVITNGTMKLGNNISLTRVNAGGNFDISTSQTQSGCLWIDGATLDLSSGCNAIVVYGKFRMSSGTFNIGREGLVIRIAGEIIFEGGTSTIEKFRSSAIAGFHIGSFTMTGGVLNVDGSLSGSSNADYPRFCHAYPGQSFRMTGGTINVAAPETGTAANGGILIGCDPGNIVVTGGTWNITLPASATNLNINSTAPFYDLNISKAGAGASTLTLANQVIGPAAIETYRPSPVPANPLVVLNNLTINSANSPNLNANGSSVTVGKDFTINNSATYTPGNNTTTFNGIGTQNFTINGTISGGLHNFTVNKLLNQSLNIFGTAATITVNNTLTIIAGTLRDNGKTINVNGDIVNSGNHIGTGSITLTGAGTQNIGGNGTGKFVNLHLNKASGATLLTANQTINGNLRLANTAAILNLQTFNLNLAANARIYDALAGVGTAFSSSRMIITSGNASDGGLTKRYSVTSTGFLFPLGTSTDYTPATLNLSGSPTTYGSVTLRPVAFEHPSVTVSGRSLTYYWRTTSSGFTLGPASMNQTYQYVNTDIVSGVDIDEPGYIAARYNPSLLTWTTGAISDVDEATNSIQITGAPFTGIDGDYTAGDDTPTTPFGTILIYYSKRNGNWNDTGAGTTPWSNVSHTGPDASTVPGPNSPVYIGDGASNNHTVTVTANATTCGTLRIASGSTLDVGTTISHNFGAIQNLGSSSGTLRVSSATPVAEFPGGDWGAFLTSSGGTVEYYSTGATDFTIPTVNPAPYSVGLSVYRNLVLNPSASRSITLPNLNLTVLNTLTKNGAGEAFFTNAAARQITVNSAIAITAGTMTFPNGFAQTLNANSNLNISTGASLQVAGTGTAVNNQINLAANLTNNGTLDFNAGSGRVCNITFTGIANRSLTGSNASAVTDLNRLTVNKGANQTPVLTLDVAGTFTAPSNNWLILQNGTFRLNKGTTITLTNTAANNYLIPATACLSVNNAAAVVNISNVSANDADLLLAGKLQIQNGTVNVGNTAAFNQDIEYQAAASPEIELTGGTLNVNGQIRRSLTLTTGNLRYTQSGTSAVVIRGQNQNNTRAKLEIENPGSSFNMSGSSTLTIVRGGGTLYGDVYLRPASSTVTGGTIIFQQGNINTNQLYRLDANIALNNITIAGTDADDVATLQLTVNPLTVKGTCLISNNFSVFNTAGIAVNFQGNLSNQNNTASAGLTVGGYRPAVATQVTTFNSAIANQTVSGVFGNLTNFANLVINNTFVGGTVSLSANTNIIVVNQLSILNGTIHDGGSTITVIGNIENSAVHASSGSGSITLNGSALQTIGGNNNGQFGNLIINNANGINTLADIRVNNTLTLTAGVLYIDENLLTIGTTGAVSGTFSATRMIRTNGALSDSGMVKLYPASASSFTFPVGVTGKYTPVTINATANSAAGTIQVRNVNDAHPATTDAAATELNYYWNVRSTGFSGLSVNHSYQYVDADVNGTEASYVGGRYVNPAWTPIGGTLGAVNAASNTISYTGVNYISGDFTAGETGEFQAIDILYSIAPGGDWNDPNTWSNVGPAGPATGPVPSFHPVIISSGHTVTIASDFNACASLQLDGSLDLSNTIGNNFGQVTGTGTLRISATGGGSFIFPGGSYTSFFNTPAATVEYYGSLSGTLFPQQTYPNLLSTGTSNKNLPGTPVNVIGNLTLQGGTLSNPFNASLSLKGNWVNQSSASGFSPGTNAASVTFDGGAQNIGGTFSTTFNNLVISGTSVKTLGINQVINRDLTISSSLDVSASNFALDVKRNFINNGTFNEQSGLITFNGSGLTPQSIGGSSTTTFHNITLNNAAGLNLNANARLENTLTCSQGTFSNASQNFTLLSTAALTARIAPLTSGNFSGNIIMERFAPGGTTGWALLSAPVSGSKISAWLDDFPTAGFNGATGTIGSFVSIQGYDETADGNFDDPSSYVPVTAATLDPITPGSGYWVYLGTTSTTTTDIVIDVPGAAVTGNFNFQPDYTNNTSVVHDGWNLVANPYPSAIDWDAASGWTRTNIDNAVYTYQADLDQYATYVGGVGTNGGSRFIASSQGFFVKANGASPVLTSTEQVKSATQPALIRHEREASQVLDLFRLRLEGQSFWDEAVVRFHPLATTSYDGSFDAFKLFSSNPQAPNISTLSEGNDYAVNALPIENLNATIPVRAKIGITGNYTIFFQQVDSMPAHVCMMFEDLYTGTITDMRSSSSYSFFANDTTWAPRFRIRMTAALSYSVNHETCLGDQNASIVLDNPSGNNWNLSLFNTSGDSLGSVSGNAGSLIFDQLPQGQYVLVYQNVAGCALGNDTLTIQPGIEVLSSFSASEDTVYISTGANVQFTSSQVGGTQWSWDFGDGSAADTAANPQHTYTQPGQYNVSLTVTDSSCSDTYSMVITVFDVVSGLNAGINVAVFLNASDWYLRYSLPEEGPAQVRLCDINGKILRSPQILSGQEGIAKIDSDDLAPGIYLLLIDYKGRQYPMKLIKN